MWKAILRTFARSLYRSTLRKEIKEEIAKILPQQVEAVMAILDILIDTKL